MNSFAKSFLLLLAFSQIFVCCSTAKNSSNTISKQEKIINSNPKFSIIIASGGGFTGTYEGYFIDTLNNVYKWEGRTFNNSEKSLLGEITKEQAQIIVQNLFDNKILSTSFKSHGNITSYISIKGEVLEHSVSWIGIEPDEKVPDNVKIFYSTLMKTIKSLSNNK